MRVTNQEILRYEHSRSGVHYDFSYWRVQRWTLDTGESGTESIRCYRPDDRSPVFTGPYTSACPCCYLNIPHTTSAHDERTPKRRSP